MAGSGQWRVQHEDVDKEGAGGVVDVGRARWLTDQLRGALHRARTAVGGLAEATNAAHTARVWTALGYRSWQQYAAVELGVSRAQAYRLLDMARTAGAITAAVAPLSPAGDTLDVLAAVSGRALRDIAGRADAVAADAARRLTDTAAAAAGVVTAADLAAAVTAAVDAARTPPPGGDPDADAVAVLPEPVRRGREAMAAALDILAQIGDLALQVAPAYVDEDIARDVLTHFADGIDADPVRVMAARRYALSGDRRALDPIGLGPPNRPLRTPPAL